MSVFYSIISHSLTLAILLIGGNAELSIYAEWINFKNGSIALISSVSGSTNIEHKIGNL